MKKTILLTISAVVLSVGCSTYQKMPLQPGEIVLFETNERADEFRNTSKNDLGRLGQGTTVIIENPVILYCD